MNDARRITGTVAARVSSSGNVELSNTWNDLGPMWPVIIDRADLEDVAKFLLEVLASKTTPPLPQEPRNPL